MTKKATCPKEKMPANPIITSQHDATTAQIRHIIKIFIINGMLPTKRGIMAIRP